MSRVFCFFVPGTPVTKGSARAFVTKAGKAIVMQDNREKQRTWAGVIRTVAISHIRHVAKGPCAVRLSFRFGRPKSHWGTGRNAGTLRPSAPRFDLSQKRDLDKLVRCVLDALTDVAWLDDGQVVILMAERVWANETHPPGVQIEVTQLFEEQWEAAATCGRKDGG